MARANGMRRVGATTVWTVMLALLVAGTAVGQQARPAKPKVVDDQTVDASAASAFERGVLLEQFIAKWSAYARDNYGTDVSTWRHQLTPLFEGGDATNIRQALQRETFEGAVATLKGRGQQVSDAEARSFASAAAAVGAPASSDTLIGAMLGALSNDLVYTPITPCRILDTRNVGGAIAAGFTRNFKAVNIADFSVQGGSATACGTSGQAATAVAINLTVVTPAGAGFATAYPFGTTRPLTATINYAAGSVVNNSVIVQIPNPVGSSDFTLYSFATADYVADIVGYFAPPVATALECTRQFGNFVSVPANTYGFGVSATCPAAYTATGLGIEAAANVVMADSSINNSGGTIFTYNLGNVAQSTRAWVQCCRVPGR